MKALDTLRSGWVLATEVVCGGDERSFVLVASIQGPGQREPIAVARYDVDPTTGVAEVALAVNEAWQGQGVGTLMFRRLWETARERGVNGFTAEVLVGSSRMLALFSNSGLRLESVLRQGRYFLRMSFPSQQQVG